MVTKFNPILREVQERSFSLEYVISHYPLLEQKWNEEIETQIMMQSKQVADEICDGDESVYWDTISSYNNNLNSFYEYSSAAISIFYNGMLLSVHAFYENILHKIIKEKSIQSYSRQNKLVAICENERIILSEESNVAKDFISDKMRIVRNNLTHNNSDTLNEQDLQVIQSIQNDWADVKLVDGRIQLTGNEFILYSLEKVNLVLKELCTKLGYKHELIKNSKSASNLF